MQVSKPKLSDIFKPALGAGVMIAHARLMGVNFKSRRALWRVGFLKDSEDAKAFGVDISSHCYVLASFYGRVISSDYFGDDPKKLPKNYRQAMKQKFTRPNVKVPGDKDDVQARHAWLIGVTRERCLWRFGFEPGSADAKAFGVSLDAPKIYVLAGVDGKIIETFGSKSLAGLPAGMREPISQLQELTKEDV